MDKSDEHLKEAIRWLGVGTWLGIDFSKNNGFLTPSL